METINLGSNQNLARTQLLTPTVADIDRVRRLDHFVLSPLRSFDMLRDNWRRLSKTEFPRNRFVLLNTIWTPAKNCSEARMRGEEESIFAEERLAYFQSEELVNGHSYWAFIGLLSLRGVPVNFIELLESLVLPWREHIAEDKTKHMVFDATVPQTLEHLRVKAKDLLVSETKNKDLQAIGFACIRELSEGYARAQGVANAILAESINEVHQSRSGKPGKINFDPADAELFAAMGRDADDDLATAIIRSSTNKTGVFAAGTKATPEVTALLQEVESLRTQLGTVLTFVNTLGHTGNVLPVAGTTEEDYKECPACSNKILKKAKKCQYCQEWLSTPAKEN